MEKTSLVDCYFLASKRIATFNHCMQWNDPAIILSVRKFGETSAIVELLAAQEGLYRGVVKGAVSKKMRGTLVQGNIVRASWQARLSEHLGSFSIETEESIASFFMEDALKLGALASASALISHSLHERDPHIELFYRLQDFLHCLKQENNLIEWLTTYVALEADILTHSGFGLDLTQCAATGTTDNLTYVSPKSGRAVSNAAGKPYHDKMLSLPAFLLPGAAKKSLPNTAEILDGLAVTGYFLGARVFEPRQNTLPAARERFIQRLRKTIV